MKKSICSILVLLFLFHTVTAQITKADKPDFTVPDDINIPFLYEYREYYVDSEQGRDSGQGTREEPFLSIDTAIRKAKPGDRIRLFPGKFLGPIRINDSGAPENPIVISSLDPENPAVIDGGWKGTIPAKGDRNPAFIFNSASWIVVENLCIENAWNQAIELIDGSYLTFRNLYVPTAGYMVYSSGNSHHILIENCYWKPAHNERDYWKVWSWEEIKSGQYKYLAQGTILGGRNLGGNIIRDNEIAYAFNGYRQDSIYNTEVYRNYFHHSRDNHIEPELYVWNLHVYHNRLDQCSEFPISIDSNLGGYMYFYGNTGIINGSDLANTGSYGKIFKMVTSSQRFLEYPMFIYHNSWYNYGIAFRKNRFQKNFYHFNNAYYLRTSIAGQSANREEEELWVAQFTENNSLSDYNSDRNPWPNVIIRAGQEQNGFEKTDPLFQDPDNSDLRLLPGSPLRDKGKVIEGFTQSFEGKAPDIGAYEGDKLVEGPPFHVLVPPGRELGYVENPRITRHRVNRNRLELFFSWPLDQETIDSSKIHLWANDDKVTISNLTVDEKNYCISLIVSRNIEGTNLRLWMDPLPKGIQGQSATHWGSTIMSSW